MNFNAGPSALPLSVLERAREELVDFEGTGMSVMEHSHRGKTYERVHEEATARLALLLGTPRDEWDVLFVQGGASTAFAQVPLNFLGAGATADYVVTGAWGEKALSEARAVRALGGGEAWFEVWQAYAPHGPYQCLTGDQPVEHRSNKRLVIQVIQS